MDNNIGVSIICTVYNHEKYLRRCLDGFISQKTNFIFEVLIHDDASTDGSADIIREYEVKYPDIIKPIYQKENQYSKGVKIARTFMLPKAKGKYLASCEGDDFWCSDQKLQIQYDYMEKHPNCTLCTHQAIKHNCLSGNDMHYSVFETECNVPIETILMEGAIFATNSCFYRKEIHINMPNLFFTKGFGDHQLIIYNTLCGYCHFFPEVMSVYNWSTEGSWTQRVFFDNKKRVDNCNDMISLMKRIDDYTNHKYSDAIQYKINKTEYAMHLANGDFLQIQKKKYRIFWGEWNPIKECIVNRFPFLRKIKKYNE